MPFTLPAKRYTSSQLIVSAAIFFVLVHNKVFFAQLLQIYFIDSGHFSFLLSIPIVFIGVVTIFLTLVCHRFTLKPVLIFLVLLAAFTSYFTNTYNVVIDEQLIHNVLHTDRAETFDLMSIKLLAYLVLLGLLPALIVYKVSVRIRSFRAEMLAHLRLLIVSAATVVSLLLIFGGQYAVLFREHKTLRYYTNPTYVIYSAGQYLHGLVTENPAKLQMIAKDAQITALDADRELIVFVVGETARADRFSLNGYYRDTNPRLQYEKVISYTNFWSCGTSTAVSVPCMFSVYNRSNYTKAKANATENVLDIVQRAGVNVLWLDNNSDSKGVAERIHYESYKSSDNNPVCDIECRDEGMLEGLQSYIDEHPVGDIFIVLHQMGSHGPAYYKRYPEQFEKYKPTCKTNQLETCTAAALNNTYDNIILYTDYFLAKVIALLKANQAVFESALFYVSDHGESLGENGVYLHGMPYVIAPRAQKQVPVMLWFSDSFKLANGQFDALQNSRNQAYSHDNIFHTILGLLEVETEVYDSNMDIVRLALTHQ